MSIYNSAAAHPGFWSALGIAVLLSSACASKPRAEVQAPEALPGEANESVQASKASDERSIPEPLAAAGEVSALIERVEKAGRIAQQGRVRSQLWMAIDTAALEHNARFVKEQLEHRKLCAVVKGDAYGLGIELVAPIFGKYADAFCLSENHEAQQLRALGFKQRLVRVRLASRFEIADALERGLELEEFVGSLAMAQSMSEVAQSATKSGASDARIAVHLVLDSTGMGRNGFPMGAQSDASLEQIAALAQLPQLEIVAITAHMPGADAADFEPTLRKARQFLVDANKVRERVAAHGHRPSLHLSNSAASARLPPDIQAQLDMDRIGGTLYGMQTYEDEDLSRTREPVTLLTHVAAVHRRMRGDTVGYGSTASVASDGFALANIGVGWQNLPRQLSNLGLFVDQQGYAHEIVGKVSMNTTIVAAAHAKGSTLSLGDPVLLLSPLGPTIASLSEKIAQPPSYLTMTIAGANVLRFSY